MKFLIWSGLLMDIVNRENEREVLPSILNIEGLNNTKNNLLVIYGKEGVGKSYLIEYIAEYMDIENKFIKIEGFSQDKKCKEYYHLDLLLKKSSKRKNIWYLLSWLLHKLSKASKGFLTFISNSLIPFEESSVNDKLKFIKRILKHGKCSYIYFKNAQNIEQESLDIFFDLSKELKKIMFIFEYTCHDDDFVRMKKDIDKNSDTVQYFEIKSIDFSEIGELFNFSNISEEKKIEIQNFYQECGGNLDKIFYQYGSLLKDKKNEFYYTKCDSSTKLLLQLINLFISSVTLKTLEDIYDKNSQLSGIIEKEKFFSKVNDMLTKEILLEKEQIITVSNTLSKEISLHLKEKEGFIAYNILISYYVSEKDYISMFKLYCLFGDDQIIQIFPQIKKYYTIKKYPDTFYDDLEKYFINSENHLSAASQERIILFMIELCIQSDFYERGIFYLNKIFDPQKTSHILMKAGLLSIADGSCDHSLYELEKLLKQFDKDSRASLIINLYKLKIYMGHKPQNETRILIHAILTIEKYKEYPEYYYLLRNYAEITEIEESIGLYIECLSSRLSMIDTTFLYGINIALSMTYAHKGEIQNAKKHNKTASFGINNGIREYYVLNNGSVIEMLNGNFSLKVLEDLKHANLFNKNLYDKIIISCNLLVYYTHQKMFFDAEPVLEYLLSLDMDNYKYEEIKHIYYQNLLYYHECVGNFNKAGEYEDKLHKLISTMDSCSYTYKITSLQIKRKVDKNIYFSNFRFRVDFLGYWDFDINLDDFL